ncbi:MAG: rhomboid family intramembrane serine protease [Bacteroidota bacterium]
MLESLKREYRTAPAYKKIFYLNIFIFIVVGVAGGLWSLFTNQNPFPEFIREYLGAPSEFNVLIKRFWTPITYAFFHDGFNHIIFNMLLLYIGGRVYTQLLNDKKFINTYFLGAIFGWLINALFANALAYADPTNIIGASAAISAIVVASAVYSPHYVINLVLLGRIKWAYVAAVLVILSFMSLQGENRFGQLSHIGGAAWGALYALQLKKGRNIGSWFDKLLERLGSLFKPKSKLRVEYVKRQTPPRDDYDFNARKKKDEEEVNAILDKISKSGHNSLTKKERDILYKASRKK